MAAKLLMRQHLRIQWLLRATRDEEAHRRASVDLIDSVLMHIAVEEALVLRRALDGLSLDEQRRHHMLHARAKLVLTRMAGCPRDEYAARRELVETALVDHALHEALVVRALEAHDPKALDALREDMEAMTASLARG